MAAKKNPGFKAVQASIAAKQNIPPANAGAILAASTRNASPAAKAANPNLCNVPGACAPAPPRAAKRSKK